MALLLPYVRYAVVETQVHRRILETSRLIFGCKVPSSRFQGAASTSRGSAPPFLLAGGVRSCRGAQDFSNGGEEREHALTMDVLVVPTAACRLGPGAVTVWRVSSERGRIQDRGACREGKLCAPKAGRGNVVNGIV